MTPPSNAGGEGRERSIVARLCRERAEGYGALRRSSLTAIALDRAADLLARENADDRAAALVEAAVVEMRERAAKVAEGEPGIASGYRSGGSYGAARADQCQIVAAAIRALPTASEEV